MRTGILLASAMLALATPAAAGEFQLTILHTNDFHSRIEPVNRYDSTCSAEDDAEGKCFGGSARLAVAIREQRAGARNSLLLDGGDQFQGSLFYTTYKGKAAAEMMNALGYDAMTAGNHEFDDGPATLAAFVKAVEFPVLMSNADIAAEPALAGKIAKSTVIEVGGEPIGLIGLTPKDTADLARPGDNIAFSDPVPAVQAEVDRLTAEGVNKIIVLSHSGYRADQRIAARTGGVDVIVGGHSHTLLSDAMEGAEGFYPTMVGDTAVVQAWNYGRVLGRLDVVFDDAGHLIRAEGEPIVMDAAIAEDPKLATRIDALGAPIETLKSEVVSETAEAIEGSREVCRARECAMGTLVADAMLARVADQGIDIAIQNGGGLRASIDAGPVTMGEVLTVLPFQNTLATFRITGAEVIAALENGVSQVADDAGRFPQVAGLKYAFDADRPVGERVSAVMVARDGGWVPIDPDAVYGVVSNNYMRGGGDGYDVFEAEAMNAYDYGPGLEVVVADYLADNTPYIPYTDGRISVK